jgi:DnaA family protein
MQQFPLAFTMPQDSTFSEFISIPANDLLLHELQQLATSDLQFCYLWGGKGTGKTHLLQALTNHVEGAIYFPVAQLLTYGPDCLLGLEVHPLIVFDDLQLLAGYFDWEEAFFTFFNLIQKVGGKLCVGSNLLPVDIPWKLQDLRSRLQLAAIFELSALPEKELGILFQRLAVKRGMFIGDEVLSFIMNRSPRSPEELLKILRTLDETSLAEQRRVTIPFVKGVMDW